MRILTITTFFPNAADPQRAVFVQNLLKAISDARPDIIAGVVAPIPWAPPWPTNAAWGALRGIPGRVDMDWVRVVHPRFLVLPRVEPVTGLGYGIGLISTLLQMRKQTDLLHIHCAYPDAVGAALAARFVGLPYIVTVHGSDINVYAQRAALRPQIAWALRRAVGIIAVSTELQERVGDLIGPLGPPVTCIPCAGFHGTIFHPTVDHNANSQWLQQYGLDGTERIILFVGRLDAIKCVDVLLRAWEIMRANEAVTSIDRIVIIGDGPCRTSLNDQCRNLGASILFTGSIPQREVALWLKRAKILCLPSRNEGTPNVVVEALACGVPVVASRVGGIPHLVCDGINGFLASPGDASALAKALTAALSRNWEPQIISNTVASLTWSALAQRNLKFIESLPLGVRHASVA